MSEADSSKRMSEINLVQTTDTNEQDTGFTLSEMGRD